MLRSASTPSLVSSLSKSPAAAAKHAPPPTAACGQVSCNVAKSLVNSPSQAEMIDAELTEIRRAQSAGNLEEIFMVSFHVDELALSRQSSRRLSRMSTLEAIPSFFPDDDEDEAEAEEEDDVEGDLKLFTVQNLATHEVRRELTGFCDVGFPGEGKMYLAAGIGVNSISFIDETGVGGCGGGGGCYRLGDNGRDGGDSGRGRGLNMENHYKNMLSQDPGNPLFLRNYAHFLYQDKGDLVGAEEYYSRAILADPEDGDVLSQYARVIWELHRDKERARSYFQRAVQASSGESNISASYASFLWDIDGEDEDEEDAERTPRVGERFVHRGIMASATA